MNKWKNLLAWAGVAFIAAVPLFYSNPYYMHLFVLIAIYGVLLLGLDIVLGYIGEVSLGHAALFGVGSYSVGVLNYFYHWQFYLTLPAAIVITGLFGLILALPSLRVKGPYLAMVTLAFGTIVQTVINEATALTQGPMGITMPMLTWNGNALDEAVFFKVMYYASFTAFFLAVVFLNRVIKSRVGRAFEALRDSPVACDCMGVSVYKHKVIAFVISAALAGLAGGLYTYSENYISPNTYGFELTVQFLLALIMGGRKSRIGVLLGAAIVVMLPALLSDIDLFKRIMISLTVIAVVYAVVMLAQKKRSVRQVTPPLLFSVGLLIMAYRIGDIADWRLTIFGMMILFVIYYLNDGIMGYVKSLIAKVRPQWLHPEIEATQVDSATVWAQDESGRLAEHLLQVKNVVMQFGGLRALNTVDLNVQKGTVHGLIGPNGSGKSTMMNVLTGIYKPTEGAVEFNGKVISGMEPSDIADAHLARTFQNVQLFGEMTALENVMVGLNHTYKRSFLSIALSLPGYRKEEKAARVRALSLLEFVGLLELANEEPRNLPYGKQRLLEIARALALDPYLLLLDEPAAGLTAPDIRDLMEIIRKIKEHGITVILIEHHMDVVMSICDTVSVLDFGQKIAEGKPAEVQNDERVIEAYLGGSAQAAH